MTILDRTALCATLLLLIGGNAWGQDRRLTDRLPTDLAVQVQQQVDLAAAAGLPTEPLIDLALEGAAKGAGDERILAAVTRMYHNLDEARARLGEQATGAELVTGAHALRQGLLPEELASLREARGEGSVQVPLTALLELVARGVPTEVANEVVARLATEASDQDFRELLTEVDQAVGRGQDATPASLEVSRRIVERLQLP